MAVVFRTAGAWGAGKGSNLTPAEVDENFYTLSQEIADIVIPNGVGVAEISVTGNKMTVHLTDGSTSGPFVLPVAAFHYQGDWEAGHSYVYLDLFAVADSGLYLVLEDYEAPTEFDPGALGETDGLPVLQLVFGLESQSIVTIEAFTADHTLAAANMGHYLRFSKASEVFLTIALNATAAIPVGSVVTINQAGNGTVTIDPVSGVVVNTPETLGSRKKASTLSLVKVDTDAWDLSGDLEPA